MALAVSLASHAANATVDPGADVRRRVVRFADLNVANPDGAAVLYSRIAHAAREVCAPEFGTEALSADLSSRECRKQAIARGVNDVNTPALTSYYQQKVQSVAARR
jgi:UrcA family protein